MRFNITFKTKFEHILKKVVLCIQIRFVSTEKTTRIASRASCLLLRPYRHTGFCTLRGVQCTDIDSHRITHLKTLNFRLLKY